MEKNRIVEHQLTISEGDLNIFAVRFNSDDSYLAAACSDGTVRIYSSSTGNPTRVLNSRISPDLMPVTSVRWRPVSALAKTKNVLIATTADGGILHWHATSGKSLHTITLRENQVLSSDYNPDGSKFAVGCKDSCVRIYDESTKQVAAELNQGEGERLGHANRVFALKWVDPNTLISAGWDNNVLLWDLRSERVARYIHGPHICGDSIDVRGNVLLTGSYHIKDQLQLWSLLDGQNICTQTVRSEDQRSCQLYAAQFSKFDGGESIAIGGSGSDEAYFYDSESYKRFAVLTNMSRAAYSIDFANTDNRVAVGCGDGSIRIFSIKDE